MNNTTFPSKRQLSFRLQEQAGDILGSAWPVSYCLKRPASLSQAVEIRHNGEHAYYHGLQTCKSAWTCPVCSSRIMAGRKDEITNILQRAQLRGWRSLFVTVTLSHHTGSKLRELLKALISAWRSVFSGDRTGERRVFSRVMAQIKSLETRYGLNGWHPHFHVLLLVDEHGLSEGEALSYEEELSETIFKRYARKVEKLGMEAERQAYDVRRVDTAGAAAHYVTKIEQALEMTAGEVKESSSGSYSMFQLLSLYESGTLRVYGREISRLFTEYAHATKGKHMISYSRQIRALGVEVKADEELAVEEEKPEEVTLAVMSAELWNEVCRKNKRSELLEVADSGDEALVSAWLEALIERSAVPI